MGNRITEPLIEPICQERSPASRGVRTSAELRIDRPDVKVIFTSGNSEEAVLEKGLPDENAAFLQKPFRLDDLARKVRDVLDS